MMYIIYISYVIYKYIFLYMIYIYISYMIYMSFLLIKDRNGMDLKEEDIKKRWQEYTEELYKKDLHNPDNHKGMIIHLELDIPEC